MNKLITTIALTLAICFGLTYDGVSAVTTPVAGVARCTATADVIDDELPYGAKIVGVKVVPSTASCYYRLRNGSSSGAIIYETYSAGTTATLTLDNAVFTKPSAGLYFETNDASTLKSITVFTGQ